jgi:hypothetical protein
MREEDEPNTPQHCHANRSQKIAIAVAFHPSFQQQMYVDVNRLALGPQIPYPDATQMPIPIKNRRGL